MALLFGGAAERRAGGELTNGGLMAQKRSRASVRSSAPAISSWHTMLVTAPSCTSTVRAIDGVAWLKCPNSDAEAERVGLNASSCRASPDALPRG